MPSVKTKVKGLLSIILPFRDLHHHQPLSFIWLTSALFSIHQCSGSPTLSVWPTSAPCGVMSPCSSASSPQPSRSTSAWCPGRKTPSPSSQVGTFNQWQSDSLQTKPAPHPPFVTVQMCLSSLHIPSMQTPFVWPRGSYLAECVLAVFDQMVDNNGKQMISCHPNMSMDGRAFALREMRNLSCYF